MSVNFIGSLIDLVLIYVSIVLIAYSNDGFLTITFSIVLDIYLKDYTECYDIILIISVIIAKITYDYLESSY